MFAARRSWGTVPPPVRAAPNEHWLSSRPDRVSQSELMVGKRLGPFAVIPALLFVGAAIVVGRQILKKPSNPSAPTKGTLMTEASDTPVLDLLARMTADSLEASTLEPRDVMIARIAALVAVNAPPASYLMNLGAASEIGMDTDQVRGVLLAIAPIVGTPRVVGATGNIMRALGFALDVLEEEDDENDAEGG